MASSCGTRHVYAPLQCKAVFTHLLLPGDALSFLFTVHSLGFITDNDSRACSIAQAEASRSWRLQATVPVHNSGGTHPPAAAAARRSSRTDRRHITSRSSMTDAYVVSSYQDRGRSSRHVSGTVVGSSQPCRVEHAEACSVESK
jgi:hypothetical protein